jgi:hypothetical protein
MLNKLDDFWFKYFSIATINSPDGWVRKAVGGAMLVPFLAALFFSIIENDALVKVFGLIFVFMLLIFGAVWIFIFFYHNLRIKHGK